MQTLMNQTIKTPKGNIIFVLDFERILTDQQDNLDMLMRARQIPFDIENTPSSDPMMVIASQGMTWTDDVNEIMNAVRSHYELLKRDAKYDAALISVTRTTPRIEFDPEDYPEARERDEWDISLPTLRKNIRNPIERRLKQIYDCLSSEPSSPAQVEAIMSTFLMEIGRISQQTDENGFQP